MSHFTKAEPVEGMQDYESVDSAVCEDCEWEGLITDSTQEEETDDCGGHQYFYNVCPKCEGAIENYYNSKEMKTT